MIQSNFNLLSSVSSVGWSLIRISRGFRYDNNGTWRFTDLLSADASFNFKGTSVWIYGAKRNNHGGYSIDFDGQDYPPYDGQDDPAFDGQAHPTFDGFNDGGLFQQVLFSAVELDNTKPHSLSILNAYSDRARPYLDVDSVSILLSQLSVGGRGSMDTGMADCVPSGDPRWLPTN